MKQLLISSAVVITGLLLSLPTIAQYGTSLEIGDFTFHNYTDSKGNMTQGTSTRIGDFTYHNFNNSEGQHVSGTSLGIGDTTFHNLNDAKNRYTSGTSMDIGDFRFHNFNDSKGQRLSGTSVQIGDFGFNNFNDSNGRTLSGTSTRIGTFTYHNFTEADGYLTTPLQRKVKPDSPHRFMDRRPAHSTQYDVLIDNADDENESNYLEQPSSLWEPSTYPEPQNPNRERVTGEGRQPDESIYDDMMKSGLSRENYTHEKDRTMVTTPYPSDPEFMNNLCLVHIEYAEHQLKDANIEANSPSVVALERAFKEYQLACVCLPLLDNRKIIVSKGRRIVTGLARTAAAFEKYAAWFEKDIAANPSGTKWETNPAFQVEQLRAEIDFRISTSGELATCETALKSTIRDIYRDVEIKNGAVALENMILGARWLTTILKKSPEAFVLNFRFYNDAARIAMKEVRHDYTKERMKEFSRFYEPLKSNYLFLTASTKQYERNSSKSSTQPKKSRAKFNFDEEMAFLDQISRKPESTVSAPDPYREPEPIPAPVP